jgi:hypothetical protein
MTHKIGRRLGPQGHQGHEKNGKKPTACWFPPEQGKLCAVWPSALRIQRRLDEVMRRTVCLLLSHGVT